MRDVRVWIAGRLARSALQTVPALMLGLATAEAGAAERPAPSIETATVSVQHVVRKCFIRSVHATGYIVPRAPAVVMFNAPDFRISEILAKPGDTIERGDVVAKAVSTASRPGEAPSNAEVSIGSMASGLILKRTAFVGMPTSSQGEPLFTLALDGDMEAMVEVPGIHVFELEAGQVAHVSMRDGTIVDGRLRLAPVMIDSATQSGQARIAFDPGAHVTLGRFVRATIEANRSCGIGVPRAAVLKTSEGPRVQVVDDGIIATRSIKLGLLGDTDIEVTEGLRDGEIVVADAGTALRDGDRIKAMVADTQDTP